MTILDIPDSDFQARVALANRRQLADLFWDLSVLWNGDTVCLNRHMAVCQMADFISLVDRLTQP